MLDDNAKVLLISGDPSWEYRALVRLLTREKMINLSCWLQSLDDGRRQQGNSQIESLPVTKEALFDQCWNSLQDGGCLVSNVVTVDGEELILQKQKQFGGSLTKIAISKLEPIGKFRGWRPQMPVTQLKISKNLGESIPNNEK